MSRIGHSIETDSRLVAARAGDTGMGSPLKGAGFLLEVIKIF